MFTAQLAANKEFSLRGVIHKIPNFSDQSSYNGAGSNILRRYVHCSIDSYMLDSLDAVHNRTAES